MALLAILSSGSAKAAPIPAPPPGGVPEGPSPAPLRAPGSIGLPAPQSPAVTSALRSVVLDGFKRIYPNMSAVEAQRRIDLQLKTPDFYGRLVGRLGIGTVSGGLCGEGGSYNLTAEPLSREFQVYGLLPYGG